MEEPNIKIIYLVSNREKIVKRPTVYEFVPSCPKIKDCEYAEYCSVGDCEYYAGEEVDLKKGKTSYVFCKNFGGFLNE